MRGGGGVFARWWRSGHRGGGNRVRGGRWGSFRDGGRGEAVAGGEGDAQQGGGAREQDAHGGAARGCWVTGRCGEPGCGRLGYRGVAGRRGGRGRRGAARRCGGLGYRGAVGRCGELGRRGAVRCCGGLRCGELGCGGVAGRCGGSGRGGVVGGCGESECCGAVGERLVLGHGTRVGRGPGGRQERGGFGDSGPGCGQLVGADSLVAVGRRTLLTRPVSPWGDFACQCVVVGLGFEDRGTGSLRSRPTSRVRAPARHQGDGPPVRRGNRACAPAGAGAP